MKKKIANALIRFLKIILGEENYRKAFIPEPNRLLTILNSGYNHENTAKLWSSENADGDPIPWFSYPAIEYLSQFNLKGKSVYEWGSGNSSLFFAQRGCSVYSIEHDLKWYEKVKSKLLPNMQIVLKNPTVCDYVDTISIQNQKFDIIIIDGDLFRYECAQIAPEYLAEGGIIILDNADWFKNSSKYLRNQNLIQIDFHGFGPINYYTSTTSIFMSRSVKLVPLNNIQPTDPVGGLKHRND